MASKTVIIRFLRNDNKEFILDGGTYGITEINGIDAAPYEIFTEKQAVGDGNIVTGSRVAGRDIEFTAVLKNRALNEVMRAVAVSFFNPKYTYKVYVTYQGVTKWIDAIVSAFAAPSVNVYKNLQIKASLYCKDPYFKSVDEFGQDIASIEARFGFPYMDNPTVGFLTGIYNFAQTVLIDNDGDVDTFCRVIIEATGECSNPKIMRGDSYIRIIDDLILPDVYEIDLVNKTVKKNGVNAIAKLDRLSDFTGMAFTVGSNAVSFDADTGENNIRVTIYFNKLYLGV